MKLASACSVVCRAKAVATFATSTAAGFTGKWALTSPPQHHCMHPLPSNNTSVNTPESISIIDLKTL